MKRRWISFACGILLGAIAVFCAWKIISTQLENAAQEKAFEAVRPSSSASESSSQSEAQYKPDMTSYEEVFDKYADMIAWITIDDTALDYPVMQTPDYPNYYLRRDLKGNYSTYGVPYMNEYCDLDQSDNLIVYGHSMKNGDMFGSLLKYEEKSYWEKHPTVRFVTRDGEREYTVLGVFKIDVSEESQDTFDYNSFVTAYDPGAYDTYVAAVKARSFYDTGVTAVRGEQLLTLSTCEYSYKDGRLVVVAKRTK